MELEKIKSKLAHTLNQGNVNEDNIPWQGVVLCLVVSGHFLFIKRSEEVPSHKGHLAFIGGHRMPRESDPFLVASREFEEETGLPGTGLEFWGQLPLVWASRGNSILPLFGRLKLDSEDLLKQCRSNGEWSLLLKVPMGALADERGWRHGLRSGSSPQQESILFRPLMPNEFEVIKAVGKADKPLAGLAPVEPLLLWGATARIIWNFFHLYFSP